MKEATVLYGPIAGDLPRVGERLRSLGAEHHALLAEALTYVFETQGKQVRPALVLLSGKLGDYEVDGLVTLAASLEVVHTATLVHDDTIDQALTRRGLKTVSAMWNPKVAILVGDFLFAQSAHLAAQLNSVRIMSLLSETVMAMSSGELRQYAASTTREIDEGDYFRRIAGKTASLFAMCCQGAGIISRQSEDEIQALATFGMNLGLAFQIVDDVLDFVGDERKLGKPAGGDLREGTITLPAILLAQRLTRESAVYQHIRNGTNVQDVISAVRDSGAIEASLQRASEYAHAAYRALNIYPASDARGALIELAERVVSRQR